MAMWKIFLAETASVVALLGADSTCYAYPSAAIIILLSMRGYSDVMVRRCWTGVDYRCYTDRKPIPRLFQNEVRSGMISILVAVYGIAWMATAETMSQAQKPCLNHAGVPEMVKEYPWATRHCSAAGFK